MDATILDRAYDLKKQQSGTQRARSEATLAVEFPNATAGQIDAAFKMAGDLIDAACAWAEEKWGRQNDRTGTPTVNLKERCPGFSAGTYSDAESWGQYLTK